MSEKIYGEDDLILHKAEAVRFERQQCIKIASSAVLKFRAKANRRYYPGYHEDMIKFIAEEMSKER